MILEAVRLKRSFSQGSNQVHALKGVDLAIGGHKLVALKGRSGSGKTTLINLLGMLDRPTEGAVHLFGRHVSDLSDAARGALRRKQIGFVFQSYALVSFMTAYENVEFGLRIAGVPGNQHAALTAHALEIVGLRKRMSHRPSELSGGEQQRVAIARAIAHRPGLILADEPTANLDSKTSLQVVHIFRELVREQQLSIVMTTHDPAMMEMVDELYELEDGRIVQHP